MPNWLAKLLEYLLIIAIPFFLILSNVFLFMMPNWLDYEYSRPGFPKADRFNDMDRHYYAVESIEYIRGNRTLDQFKALGVYVDREIKHMVDVRVLVDQLKIVDPAIAVIILISFIALVIKPARRHLAARGLLGGALLTLSLFGALGVFAALGFNTFFTLFHRVFFEGNSWLFYYSDSLIQFYPLPFWFDTSVSLVITTLIEAALIGAIGWFWQRGAG